MIIRESRKNLHTFPSFSGEAKVCSNTFYPLMLHHSETNQPQGMAITAGIL